MPFFLAFRLADLGRVNNHLIPQQSLLELLVQNFDHKEAFVDKDGCYMDINEWDEVEFSGPERHVVAIDWLYDEYELFGGESPAKPGGSIDLQWIPSSVEEFNITGLLMTGSVETSLLPDGLTGLRISKNKFQGTFAVESLPRNLKNVNIFDNQLSGSLCLESLPPVTILFNAGVNMFSGSLNLTLLPGCLGSLSLNRNMFSGKLNLENLPVGIRFIRLQGNDFKQNQIRVRSECISLYSLMMDTDSFDEIITTNGECLPKETSMGITKVKIAKR